MRELGNLVKLVGLNIREIRKSKQLTQEELSEKSGLQTSYLAGVERGERNITLETLDKIMSGLEMDPKTVFNFDKLVPDEHFNKKDIMDLINNLLSDRNIEETKLIYKITKEVFETYSIDRIK
ncbi:helix-turn-helix transcriptional regulator [Bacillaceae bacterium CLA-AA-H227]|uniref:Helix-turn-helix transcriptional regulator n=1 Tax=Robertmurraya yapensis (ex Hitch et al 2024) TaxID=3133160 RepID=A0ACC6SFU5_9BACI